MKQLATTKSLNQIATKYRLSFLRVFGSFIVNPKKARDIDLTYAPTLKSHRNTLRLIRDLETYFKRTVDLTPLTYDSPGLLVYEIAKSSEPLYEKKNQGLRDYILLIDGLVAKADEAKLYKPDAIRKLEFRNTMKALKHD